MNHLPFEDWLLNEEPLSAQQKLELQNHLANCTQCTRLAQAWSAVEDLMKHAAAVEPAPDFTQRWEGFLVGKQRKQIARRQRWLTGLLLAITGGGALLLFILLNLDSLRNLPTIGEIFTRLLSHAALLIATTANLFNLAETIGNILPFPIPLIVWIDLAMSFVLLCSAWIAIVFRLPHKRSINNETRD